MLVVREPLDMVEVLVVPHQYLIQLLLLVAVVVLTITQVLQ